MGKAEALPPKRTLRARAARRLKAYLWTQFNTLQGTPLLPAWLRRRLLVLAGCQLDPTSHVREGVHVGGQRLRMGPGTVVNIGCFLDGNAEIVIGEGVRFGPYVKVLTGTHAYEASVMRRSPHGRDIRLPVVIERGCWVGMAAIIMPGVTLAEGCIVGAGAVVLRSTEPNGLYVGNPARRVRDLPVDDSACGRVPQDCDDAAWQQHPRGTGRAAALQPAWGDSDP